MQIREAAPQDASGIASVIHAMKELRSVACRPVEDTTGIVRSNLEQVAKTGASTGYVAEDPPGTIVGYGAVHWVPFLFLPGGEAYVTELFVRPSDAGRSAGTRLLDTIVSEARRRGCARVSLLNGREGEAYRRNFYRKRGWLERDGMANFVLLLSPTPPAPGPDAQEGPSV